MTSYKIILNQKKITLKPQQLIQSGGEGLVFDLGQQAVKLYHQPQPHHIAKLQHLISNNLTATLLTGVIGPQALVYDRHHQIIGFQMDKLPVNSQAIKRLSNPIFWQKNSIQTQTVLDLLLSMHTIITHLHQLGIVIGDVNDQNIFFLSQLATSSTERRFSPFFIDVDSYQIGPFPCPVAAQEFLDPTLYHVTDFSQQPAFTPASDWYAFAVLLVKSLLQVHPYGGVHHQHKSLIVRATARLSILHTDVKYPLRARPLDTLSDELLHYLYRLFEKGERLSFPADLLRQYTHALVHCPQCDLAYSRQRSHCPACQQQIPLAQVTTNRRCLLQVDGFLEHVSIQVTGRITAVVRTQDTYQLIHLGLGGIIHERPLFNGRLGYRCYLFQQYLVVNPPHSHQLLILDTKPDTPQRLALIETAFFRHTAVFAVTQNYLYRIAGHWIMRGTIQNGHYIEDTIATAHQAQTQFWGASQHDLIAGYHRVFADYHFFLIDGTGTTYNLYVPSFPPGASVKETAVAFAADSCALFLTLTVNGRLQYDTHIYSHQGQYRHTFSQTTATIKPHHYPYTTDSPKLGLLQLPTALNLSPNATVHTHPAGLLIQQPTQLDFVANGRF